MKYKVIINNYQRGAKLKTTPTHKIISQTTLGNNKHEIVYDLDNEREKEFIQKVLNKKLIPVKESLNLKLRETNYDIGDTITYDSNIRGVNPKICKGTIIAKDRSWATKGNSAEDIYKVKNQDGNIITIDKLMIIEDEPLHDCNIGKEDNKMIIKEYSNNSVDVEILRAAISSIETNWYRDFATGIQNVAENVIDDFENYINDEASNFLVDDLYDENGDIIIDEYTYNLDEFIKYYLRENDITEYDF